MTVAQWVLCADFDEGLIRAPLGRHTSNDGGRVNQYTATVEITGGKIMLWTILVVLMILWLLGLIGGVGGGLIHLLLVVAVIVLLFQLLSGRRTVV
jgi:hypothetical protein